MLEYCQLDPWEQTSVTFYSKFKNFHSRKCTWKCRLPNVCQNVLKCSCFYFRTSARGPGGQSMAASKTKRSVAPSNESTSRMRKTIYGGGSRTILSSSSRKNVNLGPGSEKMGSVTRAPVQVGIDWSMIISDGTADKVFTLLSLDSYFNWLRPSDANMHHCTGLSLFTH